MKIHIDGIIFSLQSYGGISVYFQQLLKTLKTSSVPVTLSIETPSIQCVTQSALSVTQQAARRLERYRSCRSIQKVTSVFHSSYYRKPEQPNIPTVVTVHDFIYERYYRGPKRWVHCAQKHAAIRAAQAVICVSEATCLLYTSPSPRD